MYCYMVRGEATPSLRPLRSVVSIFYACSEHLCRSALIFDRSGCVMGVQVGLCMKLIGFNTLDVNYL